MSTNDNLDRLSEAELAEIHGGASAIDASGRVYQVVPLDQLLPADFWTQLAAQAAAKASG